MDGRRRSSLVNFRRSISFKRQSSGVSDCSADDFDYDSKASNPSNVNGTPGTPGRKSSFNKRQLLKRSYSEPIHETSAYTGDEDASFMHSLKLDEMNLNEKVFKNCAFNINGEPSGDPKKLVEASPVCPHYERKCSIISPCCGLVFGCRICHDDCDQLGPPVFNKEDDDAEDDSSQHVPRKIKLECGGAKAKFGRRGSMLGRRGSMSSIMSSISESGDDVHHNIDRFAIEEVICRECHTRQTSKSNLCINCKVSFGKYHCNICNLWMSSEDAPYHCADCGFCRVGGRENYRHCQGCGMCIDVVLFEEHNCSAGKYMSNCPVCYEDLFSSRMLTHEMPCGHNIHWHCFNSLTSHDLRCPICKKTATQDDMTEVWASLAEDIAAQPLPPDQARCVDIVCNDCHSKQEDRRWHYLGVGCNECGSFNTTHTIKSVGIEADNYLNKLDNERANA